MSTTTDQARMIGFALSSAIRRRLGRITGIFTARVPFDGRAPLRLLIAPHDLRTADPTIANDIYRGRLSLCGSVAEITAQSPFLLTPPSLSWQEELLSFSWLRHLHAAGDAISRVHARALISDWIMLQKTRQKSERKTDWQPHILARRIISWLAHSPLYLENAEPEFYRVVMRSLGRQLRYLARNARGANDGLPRLTAYIAMSYATLCISGQERLQPRAARLLSHELDRQVLPDGGHISRNPAATLELLLDLLPLRQTYISREIVPPQSLMAAIDRMLPMVRFFRHGDGEFALFNGMGRTPVGAVPAVLAYDETRGKAPDQAPHTGYQRLAAGDAVVLMDTGGAPPPPLSTRAHAGCLSFEFSVGTCRVITNCGVSDALKPEWNIAARTTAAHSTVVIDDTSSCRFVQRHGSELGAPIISGPRQVPVLRRETEDEIAVECGHDGYHTLGIIHHRRLQLSRDGLFLEGHDRLTRSSALFSRTRPFAIRFHLHPSVKSALATDGRSVLLTLPNAQVWRFTVMGASLRLEESVFLADPKGACRIEQIVTSGQCGNEAVVKWNLSREGAARRPKAPKPIKTEPDKALSPRTGEPDGEPLKQEKPKFSAYKTRSTAIGARRSPLAPGRPENPTKPSQASTPKPPDPGVANKPPDRAAATTATESVDPKPTLPLPARRIAPRVEYPEKTIISGLRPREKAPDTGKPSAGARPGDAKAGTERMRKEPGEPLVPARQAEPPLPATKPATPDPETPKPETPKSEAPDKDTATGTGSKDWTIIDVGPNRDDSS